MLPPPTPTVSIRMFFAGVARTVDAVIVMSPVLRTPDTRANPLASRSTIVSGTFGIDTAIDRFDTQYATGQMGAVKAAAPLIAQIR